MTFLLSSCLAYCCRFAARSSSWMRLLMVVGLSWGNITFAQIPGLNLPTEAAWQVKQLAFLGNQPFDQTIEKVASGQAGAFTPLASNEINNPDWYRSVWLRIHLVPKTGLMAASDRASTTEPDESTILIGLNKPYLDDIILFTPALRADATGSAWQQQRGGDHVARKEWTSATRGLMPRFALPSAARVAQAGEQGVVLYLQIKCLVPSLVSPQWLTQQQFEARDFQILVLLCLCFGAMALMVINALGIARAQRSWLYAWYGLYALLVSLATASHSGLLHKLIWPIGGQWPGTATLIFLVIACPFQVYFCRHIYQSRRPDARWTQLSHLTLASTVLLCAVFVSFPSHWQIAYFWFIGHVLGCAALCGYWMIRLAYAGEKLAIAWTLAFVPMCLTAIAAILDGIGLIPDSAWTHTFSLVAAALEVVILGIVLQFFARARHGEKEHQRALASTDPLTGFVGADVFQRQLQRDWHAKNAKQYDMAVIYIELQTKAQDAAHLERLLVRVVRVLRSATHPQDVVARLDNQLMAILMPHVQMGDDLNQRLSRVVALGLMPDRSDTLAPVLHFRIAASTRWSYTQPLAALHRDLRTLLAQPSGWGRKPIRFLNQSDAMHNFGLTATTSAFSDFWDKAFVSQKQT